MTGNRYLPDGVGRQCDALVVSVDLSDAEDELDYWRTRCGQRQVGLIDHFPDFVSEDADAGEVVRILRRDFVPGDVHRSAAGHRKIAAGFLKAYRGPGADS